MYYFELPDVKLLLGNNVKSMDNNACITLNFLLLYCY